MGFSQFLYIEKLTDCEDEIKRLEDNLQQSRDHSDEREKQFRHELESKVSSNKWL
jgi:hypothetical protein